ncbi:hypothetical protein [Arsukibacterium sp.]|uniref:hypothetical protein n=1 Tax=Arsukibacterium sp. TaxID=1977258 RepID=UPI0035639587
MHYLKLPLVALLALFSHSVTANGLVCAGEVETLSYHADSQLMIKLSSMNTPVFFCSPDNQWVVNGTAYKTSPQACQAMYSTFLAAKMAGKPVANMYFDGDQVPASCNGWSSWAKANIRHYLVN